MNIIDKLFNRFGFISEKDFNQKLSEAVKGEIDRNLPAWLGETADAQKWDIPSPTIFATQADMYRLSPILGTAVSILGNDIGTSKLNVKRMVGEETRDIPNHPLELLLRNPNPADTGIEFLVETSSSYLLNGNAVWWKNAVDQYSPPDELWPIPFSAISPVPDKQMYVSHYEYFPGNGKTPMRLETWEVVHFKTYNPNNRFVGLSPLESLAVTLQGDQAMRSTNARTYADYGGAPQSLLTFKDFVPDPAWTDVKAEVRNAAKRNEMMMLRGVGDGVSWLQRALSNRDMDFIGGLKQNMTDVFNRMCPGLLNMLSEGATYSNADAARATYSEMTKWPIMEVIAQKITTDILPVYGRKLIAQFDDPRFVDRAVKLQERAADEKIMTVQELRKEYKELEPFGDERDDLLLSQINAQTGKPEPAPAPIVTPTTLPTETLPTDMMPMDETPADETAEPVKADLARWKRYAVRTFGKATFTNFRGRDIPESITRATWAKLAACKSTAEVVEVFENINPAPVDRLKELADAINRMAGA